MIDDIRSYQPGHENREDYTEAKRKLLTATTERSVCMCEYAQCDTVQDLMERVNCGDVDDNEFDLDVQFSQNEQHLMLRFVITDERSDWQDAPHQPGYLIKEPAVTECFHRDITPRERILLARITFGRAYCETTDPQEIHNWEQRMRTQNFIELLEERYMLIVRECTRGLPESRKRFDTL